MADKTIDMSLWPMGLKKLAEVIGPKPTLDFVSHFGGLDKLHVPVDPDITHPWAQAIGIDNLRLLSEALGGERISIPRGAFLSMKKIAIMDLAERNWSPKAIAREVECTERYVQKVLQVPEEDNQQNLF